MGNYVDALEQAMQAIMLAPTSSDAYYQRAAVYNSLRDRERAVADYNTVIQLDPTAAQAFYQRGCLHATKFNDYTAAVAVCPQGWEGGRTARTWALGSARAVPLAPEFLSRTFGVQRPGRSGHKQLRALSHRAWIELRWGNAV